MDRRNFLNSVFAASAGLGIYKHTPFILHSETGKPAARPLNYLYEDNSVTYYISGLEAPLKIIQITDTHLWMDDSRGDQFREYSKRMAGAYNVTKHYKTGAETTPDKSFTEALDYAVESKADLIALTGDIFSFPSEAAIEWAYTELQKRKIPFVYTAGNHDWHYEGMKGSSQDLRNTWIRNRLERMYQGNDPLMYSYLLKGIKVIMIDNSVYDILPAQHDFLLKQEKENIPYFLMIHIPMYVPGKGYGIGDPGWGAAKDKGYEVERREKWPDSGHMKSTFGFYNTLISSQNLLGIFAGHTHRGYLDVINGLPQFVTNANATGAYTEINIIPLI